VAQEGFPRELLNRPAAERLAYFRSYTVAHPLLKEADAALKRAIQEPAGGSLVFVLGPTGVGKTTLRLRIEQYLKEAFLSEAKEDVGRIPVIGVEAVAPDSGNFNWKDYYQRALRALEEPLVRHKIDYGRQDPHAFPNRTAGTELRYALEQALRFRRPAAVMVDEAQHLTKMASGRKLSDQLDSLKSLASLTSCVHVLIGTYELLPCRNLNAQLSRRSIDIHFRRYQTNDLKDVEAFQRVLFSFQRQLPLAEEPQLWRDWEYCYSRSIGCVGILKDWLARGFAAAMEEGAATLTHKHLEKYSWSMDQCQKMVQEALEGESALTEKKEARLRLLTLLGLESKPRPADAIIPGTTAKVRGINATLPGGRRRRGRVGERSPVRDDIGRVCQHAG
jgi:energy-coupling factor transporter ATP-binding protein EcfA2